MKPNFLPINIRAILPCIFGGGILVAIAFFFDDYSINPETFGTNLPQGAFFMSLGSAARLFVLPLLAGAIARSLGGRNAWIAGIVGGMLAGQSNSGFLGAVLAGYLAGWLTIGLKHALEPMSHHWETLKNNLLIPLFGILLIGIVMQLIVRPLSVAINEWAFNALNSLGNSPMWLGAALGGMLGIDINGPLSQAAYMFGIASLAGDQFMIMSSVMAGGMALPICSALSALFFRKHFSREHYQFSVANILLGFAFLPEGAIPLAAQSPLYTIPAYIISGSVAGLLSMLFRCTVHVPYGGVFVWQAIGNRLGFFTAVVVGAFAGMLAMILIRKISVLLIRKNKTEQE